MHLVAQLTLDPAPAYGGQWGAVPGSGGALLFWRQPLRFCPSPAGGGGARVGGGPPQLAIPAPKGYFGALLRRRPVVGRQRLPDASVRRSSSGVEQRIRNAWVGGSNPSCGTNKIKHLL